MTTNLLPDQAPPLHALDPCLLGRPVHLLGNFATRFREDLALALRSNQNRRYWSAFEVTDVGLDRRECHEGSERWIGYTSNGRQLGFAIERHMLLKILDQRYGRRDEQAQATVPARVTATEERLAVRLGQQLVQALIARLEADAQTVTSAPTQHPWTSTPMTTPPKGRWTLRIVLTEVRSEEQGVLWLTLDDTWFAELLKGLAPVGRKIAATPSQPLAERLQVSVCGRLTSKEIPLEALLELRVGDVVPIRIGRTDVLLDDAPLFTATLAEHNGKLCLTSFKDTQ
ncbi:MAG TPA: FliM/FliN family flagellar motor C-terminal domain-containing protein [Burkholderiaceae bacterium]|nr:FliM/FliN family flagellar motor C-terminal domain-containing protein [Burkholderiaceae bacterium]